MDDLSLLIRRNKRCNDPKISLSSRMITLIPSQGIIQKIVFNLTHLEILDLSNNKISTLDSQIQNLKLLKMLDLSYNSITQIEMFVLKMNLQILNLSNNPLQSKFQKLNFAENQQQPKLEIVLKECFQSQVTELAEKPKWFFEGQMNQTFSYNKKDDIENLLKDEQQKVIQLKTQLEQLQIKDNQQFQNVERSEFSNYDLDIEYEELKINKTINQGYYLRIGGFSLVYQGDFRGTEVCIKKIFDPNVTQELLDEFQNEIKMLNKLRHPNIILLMAVVSKPPNLCIVTEYMPKGSLFFALHQSKKELNFQQKISIAIEIGKSLLFLHYSKIVHRDIKSHNILLDENNITKLCDFGLAKNFCDLNKGTRQFCGTPAYMAPELFQKKAYNYKIDIFAYGTLLWEIFSREVPYEGQDPQDIMKKVMQNEPLNKIDNQINFIIAQCRDFLPENRPDIQNIILQLNQIKNI